MRVQNKAVQFKCEHEFDLLEYRGGSGLRMQLLPHGGLYAIRHSDVMINQVNPNPPESGMMRLFLRVSSGGAQRWTPVVGPGSKSRFSASRERAGWTGGLDVCSFQCALSVHKEVPLWCWMLRVRNEGTESCTAELLYGQDIGLAQVSALRTHEAYVCQYLDHHVHFDPSAGYSLFCRQNQKQGEGTHPWLLQGCRPGAASYCTDGFQFFGTAYKATNVPAALAAERLPSEILQYEFAYTGLQTPSVKLQPGEELNAVFYGYFLVDHPHASGPSDTHHLSVARRCVEGMQEALRRSPPMSAPSPSPANWFETGPPLEGAGLAVEEVNHLFSDERRHEEWGDRGELLSFFYGNDRHVVLKAKEILVERSHGHILRSGRGIFPEAETVCTTAYCCGIFNSHLTCGNTNFGKLLSVVRNPLNVLKSGGQRIFASTPDGWRLLGLPSAFEMGIGHCRWLYKLETGVLEVCVTVSMEQPAVLMQLDWHAPTPTQFLISHHIVLGATEHETGGQVEVSEQKKRVVLTPAAEEPMAESYPEWAFCMGSPDPERVATIGHDELLSPDGTSMGYPYVVFETDKTFRFRLFIAGSLNGSKEAIAKGEVLQNDFSTERALRAADRFGSALLHGSRLSCDADQRMAKLDDVLRWYSHNAMIHFTVPHGLEQYGGAAWGVRDVCQGPVEFLLASGRAEPVAQVLKLVFAHQYASDGTWPQWFMFDAFTAIQQPHCHGDIVIWPLKALCDYVEATDDIAILGAKGRYTRKADFSFTGEDASIFDHVRKLIAHIDAEFVPGTALLRYGDGDWDDTLQPAESGMRTRMVSSWTVALVYQTLCRYERVCRRAGEEAFADELASLAGRMRDDFNHYLVADGVVCGFALFDHSSGDPHHLLHPRERDSGIQYRLLPMTRGILSEIFTPEQAASHLEIIREHLWFPDGVRLMDQPVGYHGGVMKRFKRAETAAYFGREVGLQYVHAHLRYAEALARCGRAAELLDALLVVNPINITDAVPNAITRQSNAYFSSSDAAFLDRYQASERFSALRDGEIRVKGGWRIYSSGPGIYVSVVVRSFLGCRYDFDDMVFDPVLDTRLDEVEFDTAFEDRRVRYVFHVESGSYSPKRIVINGDDIPDLRYEYNPYRSGGARVSRSVLSARLSASVNRVDIYL